MITSDDRRRSEARIAALAAEIHAPELTNSRVQQDPACRPAPRTPAAQPFVIFGGGALAFAALIALAIVAPPRWTRVARTVAPPPAVSAPSLELVALGQQRAGDELTVRGVVRNPESGAGVDQLTAVVFLFTADGGFLDSARASVAAAALRPGGETTFAVTLPRAADAGRYRVSFRSGDHLVSHVDRRHEQS